MKKIIKTLFLCSLFTLIYSCEKSEVKNHQPIKHWQIHETSTESYRSGLDEKTSFSGKYAGFLESTEEEMVKGDFCTLMRSKMANKYRGKRVKMSAFVKSENVEDWAGLWMRVDSEGNSEVLGFDNMMERPIIGTTDWKQYEITLFIPDNSGNISFGALLSRKGKIWVDDFKIEVVDEEGKSIDNIDTDTELRLNLDFEDAGSY